ncbi:MAG TPA: proton-conducting transporter membrane subunit, partial [Acidimicrobiia bacterium]|nr:proton-conducting transporter membrane subunit [Acidimicrobiia bacterium]
AVGQSGADERNWAFHPVYLVLAAGASMAYLTGDLFNLFVAVEVTLSASYVLMTIGGRRDQVRAGMTYVVMNLLGSFLFVTAVGLVYAATGTLNIADLVGRLDDIDPGVRHLLGLLLLVAFGVKAGVFPLFSWLPDSYPTAPSPVSAVFAGLLTKIGVYAIIRTQVLLFPGASRPSAVILAIASFTMIVGVVGAIAQDDMKRILSFHIVSQIGYMIMGLALFTVAGVAGGIYYILHHVPVKTSLFLVGGVVERATGTASLRRLGGLARKTPAIAVLFLVAALSLAGLPPLSGFVGKLALVEAGLSTEQWGIVGVSLAVSLLTLFSMLKIWNGVFWGEPEEPASPDEAVIVAVRPPRTMMLATVALVAVTLLVAASAGPLYDLSERAAADLLRPEPYVRAVLGR